MKLLDRYLARVVIMASMLVLMVLVTLDAVFAVLSELDSVGEGDYRILDAFVYVALTLPRRIYSFFPTAVLIGSLLGLGTLASNSELVVMRAAGISNKAIVAAVIRIGLVLALLTLVFGEWLAPPTEQFAQQMRSELMAKRVSLHSEGGLWIREGARYINVKRIQPGLHLQDITVYEFQGDKLLRVVTAASARYQQDTWELSELAYSVFGPTTVQVRQLEVEAWPYFIDPGLFSVLLVTPDTMSFLELYRYVGHLKLNGLDYQRFELSMWRKLAIPLSTLVMLSLAIPFVFGSVRTGRSGQRVLIGCLIGIGYFLLDRLFTHIAVVYGLIPIISAFMPLCVFSFISIYRLRQIV